MSLVLTIRSKPPGRRRSRGRHRDGRRGFDLPRGHRRASRLGRGEIARLGCPLERFDTRQVELLSREEPQARDRGFEVAREMLTWSRTELAGAYLIPPFKRYEEILDIL
jgi:hypothetical protein